MQIEHDTFYSFGKGDDPFHASSDLVGEDNGGRPMCPAVLSLGFEARIYVIEVVISFPS